MVIDNGRQELGYLLGHGGSDIHTLQVFIPNLSATIVIHKLTGRVVESGGSPLYYESSNCTGQPYMAAPFGYVDVIVKRRAA
jgi:hypothetical protein